ncbi:MAG: response regulator [Mucilaginibacter sp.]
MAKKILILDDNEDILEMMKVALEDEGHEVECMTDTDDIYKTISHIKPDLLIVDYILTDINGGEFCHQVKTNPQTAHIPVIMVSGHQRVLESFGTTYGADVFIAKPFSLEDIVNNVNDCLTNAEHMAHQH